MKEIMLFQAGNGYFGLYLSAVKGVHRAGEIPDLPCEDGEREKNEIRYCRMPEGTEILLYDFPMIFGGNTASPPLQKLIRIDVGSVPLAILADHIDRVVETGTERILPLPPVFGEKSKKWFPYIFTTDISEKDTRLIPILNPAGMAGIDPGDVFHAGEGRCDPEDFLCRCIRPDVLEAGMLRAIRRGLTAGFHREGYRFSAMKRQRSAGRRK